MDSQDNPSRDATRRQASEDPETDDPRPRKRRSRATVACRVCRTRKTRCDNRRPTCGYCSMQGLTCDYPSNTAPDLDQDASNKAILAKINHAVTLLEELKSSHQISSITTRDTIDRRPDTRQVQQLSTSSLDANSNQVGVTEGESAFTDDGFGRLEIPEAAARSSACESLLRWPVLTAITGNSAATSFALEEAACNTSGKPRQQGVIDQDGIWPLCRRFLALIHVKNPILDVSDFVQHARNAAEYGPGWDEAGCLVLLACALACVATPYDPDQAYTWQTEAATEDEPTNQEGVDISMAEAFFGAARRRLGLLTNSVIAVQCQYLAGLYEKFLVRPLAAWSLLQTACAQLQALLYAKGLAVATRQDFQTGKRTRHIEQRLYWSCVKAEW
ncbi:vegetative cell wall gp1 [Fusarium albosuccineum]|uniref:Vegetative cell wall gp1 n=1 Tax=Fusarium albosuccineum TaxID=1237068 RepID=A0A8H4KDG7_9HYPO|nr:vegetative cell wall gp1 [Fusarium albosuccineum]